MVQQIKFSLGDSNEIIINHAGKWGAKGEKRGARIRPTSEQQRKVNQRNRENRLRRTIALNFKPEDLWCTLKYPSGTHKTTEELRRDFDSFIRAMKYRYKKVGQPLKYIYRMERGSKGGLHIHVLVNRIADTDRYLTQAWKAGHVWYTSIYDEGGYEKLAAYITKKPERQVNGQMSLDEVELEDELLRYNCSRNLKKPIPEVKRFSHWTLRKYVDGDMMPKPTKGYVVDKSSIRSGVNPYTGLSYFRYVEYRVRRSKVE